MLNIQSTEFGKAFEEVQIARKMIADAYAAAERAKAEIISAARQYLMSAEGEELIDRATEIYWNCPDVPTSVISSVVLGDPKAPHRLLRLLRQVDITSPCRECGVPCPVPSRSRLAEINKSGKFRSALICSECEASLQAKSHSSWLERERLELDRAAALHTMPYRDYLLTEEWLETRNRKLKQARFKCQLCNDGGLLNVHHRTYERRGSEWMADLVVLCRPCHAKFHDKMV